MSALKSKFQLLILKYDEQNKTDIKIKHRERERERERERDTHTHTHTHAHTHIHTQKGLTLSNKIFNVSSSIGSKHKVDNFWGYFVNSVHLL